MARSADARQNKMEKTKFSNLNVPEKAIVWILLNTELKLSCEDLAAILDKNIGTIKGQINAIKQKGKGILKEMVELNGKKRYFVAKDAKDRLLSKVKEMKLK